jgi:hypothetical protein
MKLICDNETSFSKIKKTKLFSAFGSLPVQSSTLDPHTGSRPVQALLLSGEFPNS